VDCFSHTSWATEQVAGPDAAAYWSDAVCETFVGVAVRPAREKPFRGRIEHSALDEIDLMALTASAQQVNRTRRLIARDREEYVLANIQVQGQGRLEQDGRAAVLSPGTMSFVDSTRPFALEFGGDFSQLVVKIPRVRLSGRSLNKAMAVELGSSGPGRLVADFLVGLDRLHANDPGAAAVLTPHALDLVDSALAWAADRSASPVSAQALTRERIHRFVRRHACDASLDADMVAGACNISRRTLFRALATEGESLSVLIRRIRVARAQKLLLADPSRPLASVAHECGFGGEAQLGRAFREVTGMTPGTYRAQQLNS